MFVCARVWFRIDSARVGQGKERDQFAVASVPELSIHCANQRRLREQDQLAKGHSRHNGMVTTTTTTTITNILATLVVESFVVSYD